MSSGPLTVEVDLADGARITRLCEHTSGREWLADDRRPGRAPRGPRVAFADTALSGWDECAPTVDACVVDTAEGPWAVGDHGELWSRPWTGDTVVHEVRASRFSLQRTMVPTARGVRLDYRVTPHGPRLLPFLWTAHPQFRLRPGTRLVLPAPAGVRRVQPSPDLSDVWSEVIDPTAPVAPGRVAKWWLDPEGPAASWAALLDDDGGWLRMRWDPADLPYLGIWVDRGCLADGEVLAIEPSTDWYDRLDRAVAADRVWTLYGAPRHWSVLVEVGRDGDPRPR
ncbi:MAG: hypothetical protein H0T85_06945 [Geodermatophilaceae bacterium]|nr:hypothetical protein [Geodermatophilaceae bacterium]